MLKYLLPFGFLLLTACHMPGDHRICINQGYEEDSPAFRECVKRLETDRTPMPVRRHQPPHRF